MQNPMRILVVDDDVDNAFSLGELLEMEGHQVRVVHTGEDAIRASLQEHYNLSFMDVILPGLNGVESFMQIRSARPDARVYMMTGFSVEQLLTQALDGGALGVLEKPFDPEAILNLTASVGPSGLVVAPPGLHMGQAGIGPFIRDTLKEHGRNCCHITQAAELSRLGDAGDVLLIDTPEPLIDGMQVYKAAQAAGHKGQTVLVPHVRETIPDVTGSFDDVRLTGILNKPFDPLELINKLPQLAA